MNDRSLRDSLKKRFRSYSAFLRSLSNQTGLRFKSEKLNNVAYKTNGTKILGAPIGTKEYTEETVKLKCEKWIKMVAKLSIISDINPQIAYLGLTKSLQSKWIYFLRATKIDPSLLQDLNYGIFSSFVKQLTKQYLDHNWHSLLSLPVRLGGLGIDDPTRSCSFEYDMTQRLWQTFD
ncbi:hypothetical protein GJ496_005830 [Pomphorhynchus laevis]|nr:hypothetical protein GJ496_005830 [Pomphorhynchus laevis]